MSYIDGFVIAVPNANREQFIRHARTFDTIFLEFGATRVLECWGDNVPEGKLTDFPVPCRRSKTSLWCSPGWSGPTRPPATPAWRNS